MAATSGPNADHIQCWNQILEPKFNRFREVMLAAFARHSDPVLAEHGPKDGERVIDVGCGWGDTTLQLARRVGDRGAVLGIDCVEKFLDHGRAEVAAAGLRSARFVDGDAQTFGFEPGHDLVFARFGTMFFASPVAALRNLGRATRPGGRLAMIVWRALEENEWLSFAKEIALRHLPPPGEGAATCGPGPFSMSDRETVRAILDAAGWQDAAWRPIDTVIDLGGMDDAIAMQMAIGPAGEIIREAGDLGDAKREVIVAELIEAMRGFSGNDGRVVVSSASWCITARWPG